MPSPVDAYLNAQPAAARHTLAKVRAVLRKALPGATEEISYRIPTYKLNGKMVLYFAGFPNHYAIYPATPHLIQELGRDLENHLHGKGTIRFSYDKPVPVRLIERIAKARAAEAGQTKAANNRKKPVKQGTPRTASRRVTMYGIPNCDTIKKARTWLDEHAVAYDFHDYKKSGIDAAHLEAWSNSVGWETILNRAGTTFRKLSEKERSGIDKRKAIALMIDQPSMIKRPVLDVGGKTLLVGFKPDAYAAAFKPK